MRGGLATAYRALGRAGLIAGSSGNVSTRQPGAPAMLISPTGASPDTLSDADLIETGLDHAAPGASSEWALHAALYRARPELNAVVHTHGDHATALSCLGQALPAFHYDVLRFGGADVRCAPYVTFGTPELAQAVLAAMQDRTACLLGNHGMIAAGPTLKAACAAAELLERLCRQYLLACAAGTPRVLTPQEVEAAQARFAAYQQAAQPAQPGDVLGRVDIDALLREL